MITNASLVQSIRPIMYLPLLVSSSIYILENLQLLINIANFPHLLIPFIHVKSTILIIIHVQAAALPIYTSHIKACELGCDGDGLFSSTTQPKSFSCSRVIIAWLLKREKGSS